MTSATRIPWAMFTRLKTTSNAASFAKDATYSTQQAAKKVEKSKKERPATNSVSMMPSTAHVYTDGACSANGTGHAVAGIGVYWGDNDFRNVSERLSGEKQTNNRAEIQAAVRAIRDAKKYGFSEVIIYTDSSFMIESMTKYIHKWLDNGWKRSGGGMVINKEDFLDLMDAKRDISVSFKKVEAHTGDLKNDEADRLAKEAIVNSCQDFDS